MFSYLWNNILYRPLLNAMAFLTSVIPGGDIGIAIILLTILVKILLFPLSEKSIESQAAMNSMAPELEKIKKSGESKEEQARMTFELYKKHNTNPFSGCLLVFVQIPIIFALYYVFIKGIKFDPALLYGFIHAPLHMNMLFLGLIDISQKSILLAIIAGISQYFQATLMPKPPALSPEGGDSFQASFGKSMNTQMKYIFPFIIGFITYRSGVVALYFITSNVFAICQQLYVNKKREQLIIK